LVSTNVMKTTRRKLDLSLLPGLFAVARLAPGAEVPPWAMSAPFFSVTRTAEELSVVTAAENVPNEVQQQANWRVFKLHGPFAFSEIGVLSAIVGPLADAKIGVFAISTFDTDYLLVVSENLQSAVATLKKAGHTIHGRFTAQN
jgi:uncharacterized protein